MALGNQIQKRVQATEFAAMAEPYLCRCQLLVQALHAWMPPGNIARHLRKLGETLRLALLASRRHQYVVVRPAMVFEVMLVQHSTRQDENIGHALYQCVQRRILFAAVQHIQVDIGVMMGEKVQRGAQAGLADVRVVMNGDAATDPIFLVVRAWP